VGVCAHTVDTETGRRAQISCAECFFGTLANSEMGNDMSGEAEVSMSQIRLMPPLLLSRVGSRAWPCLLASHEDSVCRGGGGESSIWTFSPIGIGFTGPSALLRADDTTQGGMDVQTNGEQASVTRPPCPLGVQSEDVDGWSGKVTTQQSNMRVESDSTEPENQAREKAPELDG